MRRRSRDDIIWNFIFFIFVTAVTVAENSSNLSNGVPLKMPPRISARRLFLLIATFSALTLLLAHNGSFPWARLRPPAQRPPTDDDPTAAARPERAESADAPAQYAAEKRERAESADAPAQYAAEKRERAESGDSGRPAGRPWFMRGGTEFPEKHRGPLRLFPDQADGDRVVEQLMYVPEDYQGYDTPEKTILAYNGLGAWGEKSGSASFHGCPVSRCSLTDDRSKAVNADAILYKDHFIHPGVPRPMSQVWIIYFLECPYHTQSLKFADVINWTATYRRDSDIVAPYERWTYYDSQVRQKDQNKDFTVNKTKKVAWFVSNCGARNGRLAYARELAKYIPVDIYGTCGPHKCPRTDKKCFEILEKEYKFYLAFENSNCRDYITEKFYVNGLGQNVLPIVMGGRPEDYQRSAPEGSYIHVDEFAGPEELAAYLHRLDKDDALYNSYFRWKGTGEFVNTYFWCRLCALLHAPAPPTPRRYDDVNDWWRGPGVCTPKSWRAAEVV